MIKISTVFGLDFPLIIPALVLAWLAMAVGPAAAAPRVGAGKERQSGQAGRHLAQSRDNTAHHGEIPSLDLKVPAHIETATFALG